MASTTHSADGNHGNHGNHGDPAVSTPSHRAHSHHHPYRRLALMTVAMFIAMFALMYAMVDRWSNVYGNVNQIYMAGLMTASMVMIELAFMRPMYPNRKANVAWLAASGLVLILCWFGIRAQAGVGDRQFLRSMIPHHAGALLMCQQASLSDPGLEALCQSIMASQTAEIQTMTAKLRELTE